MPNRTYTYASTLVFLVVEVVVCVGACARRGKVINERKHNKFRYKPSSPTKNPAHEHSQVAPYFTCMAISVLITVADVCLVQTIFQQRRRYSYLVTLCDPLSVRSSSPGCPCIAPTHVHAQCAQ